MKKYLSIFIILTFIPYELFAFKFTAEVCKEYGLGSNWHCETERKEDNEEQSANDIMNSDIPAEQKAIQLNNLWETQIKRATITGSKEDIQNFLATHNLITSKGINFAKNVQKVIETNPKLFNSDSYYKNAIDQQIRAEENKELLRNSSQRYGLVFIYNPSCPYCIRQLPIILRFKEEFNFKVLGITIDNDHFPGLDQNIVDPYITNDPLIQSFPTILLLDREHPGKIFISKGLTTSDELEEKIVKRISEREAENAANH